MDGRLLKAAHIALFDCLGLKATENLLIVVDPVTLEVGTALREAASGNCRDVLFLEMSPRARHGDEPPEPVAAAMAASDVMILPTTMSLTHTAATRRATKEFGRRAATMPSITPEIFAQLGNADLTVLVKRTKKLAEALRNGTTIRVISPSGTDLTFSRGDREVYEDCGLLSEPGKKGNLPPGEAFFAPPEGSANGHIVVDVSMAGIGLLSTPITILVEKGVATYIDGGADGDTLRGILEQVGPKAFTLAEFGVGTLPVDHAVGNILLDEKMFGTCHFAFGNNMSMGGVNDVPVHLDGIVNEPTIVVDGETLMQVGTLVE